MVLLKIFKHNKKDTAEYFPSFQHKEEMPFSQMITWPSEERVAVDRVDPSRVALPSLRGPPSFQTTTAKTCEKETFKSDSGAPSRHTLSHQGPLTRHHAELINRTRGSFIPSVPMLLYKINVNSEKFY